MRNKELGFITLLDLQQQKVWTTKATEYTCSSPTKEEKNNFKKIAEGLAAYACTLNTQNVEAGQLLGTWGQPGLHNEFYHVILEGEIFV